MGLKPTLPPCQGRAVFHQQPAQCRVLVPCGQVLVPTWLLQRALSAQSSQMNGVLLQSSAGLSNVVQFSQSRARNLQYMAAVPLPPACFNLINRGKREGPQPRKPIALSLFKSIPSTDPKPKKRTYAEFSQSQSAFRPHSTQVSENTNAKRQRFLRTAEALEKSGLMKVTMESAALLQQNKHLQKEIEELKTETQNFLQWVMSNPENKHLRSTC